MISYHPKLGGQPASGLKFGGLGLYCFPDSTSSQSPSVRNVHRVRNGLANRGLRVGQERIATLTPRAVVDNLMCKEVTIDTEVVLADRTFVAAAGTDAFCLILRSLP